MYYLLPALAILMGAALIIAPPKDRNGLIGIRMSLAKKSEGNWTEAQRFGGIVFVLLGIIDLPIVYIAKQFLDDNLMGLFGALDFGGLAIITVIIVYVHLKKFDQKNSSTNC